MRPQKSFPLHTHPDPYEIHSTQLILWKALVGKFRSHLLHFNISHLTVNYEFSDLRLQSDERFSVHDKGDKFFSM